MRINEFVWKFLRFSKVFSPWGGAKIRWANIEWSENLKEAKFEKNKVRPSKKLTLRLAGHAAWKK